MAAERPFDWEKALLVEGWMMNGVCMVSRLLFRLDEIKST